MALSRLRASSAASSLESNNPHLRLLNLYEWVMNPHPQPHTPMSCLVAVTKLTVIHDTRRRMYGCTLQNAFLIICGPTTCWNIKKLCILSTQCVCVNFTQFWHILMQIPFFIVKKSASCINGIGIKIYFFFLSSIFCPLLAFEKRYTNFLGKGVNTDCIFKSQNMEEILCPNSFIYQAPKFLTPWLCYAAFIP